MRLRGHCCAADSRHNASYEPAQNPLHADLAQQYRMRLSKRGSLAVADGTGLRITEYSTAEAHQRPDVLRWRDVREQFNEEAFLRDGVQVFQEVFTDDALREIIAATARVQALNDEWLVHDWHEATQWAPLALKPPTVPPLTPGEKALALGKGQMALDGGRGRLSRIFRSVEENTRGDVPPPARRDSAAAINPKGKDGVSPTNPAPHLPRGPWRDERSWRWPLQRGFMPEHCAMAVDPYFRDLVTHPQMIALHRMMLGAQIRFDHCTLISRSNFAGQHWHSHHYQEDNLGVTTDPGGAQARVVRSLVYPNGFNSHLDGGLKVVRGGHLYRMGDLNDGYERRAAPGDADDAEFAATWLAGKRHPITGRPLTIEKLALRRGSIVCVLGHVPHAVSPRPAGRGTRLCTLLAYRQPGKVGSALADGTLNTPWEVERDADAGKIPGVPVGPPNLFSLY